MYDERCKIDYLRKEYLKNKAQKKNIKIYFTNKTPSKPIIVNDVKRFKTNQLKLENGSVMVNTNLSDKQLFDLKTLIEEYDVIFAFDPKKLGCCTVLEHTIELVDNSIKLIKQTPYKYSMSQRNNK